jgi:hypothetical protein
MVRYADDAVIGCERREDAERIYKVLAARFEKYELKLHPEKTKLLDFTKPEGGKSKGNASFAFLGFTHYWTKSRKGKWIVGRKTEKTRLRRALQAVSEWCRKNRHKPMKEQREKLCAKLTGHYAYYGISLNYRSIMEFYDRVRIVWRKWLNQRSRKADRNWKSFLEYLNNYPLPKPRIMHSYC